MDMEVTAYAKINLTLDVLYRRPDGYHQLSTIMSAISLCDRVRVEEAPGVSVECGEPLPHDNTARRAAGLFYGRTGHGGRIYIEKGVPSEAGLGGASADAAAVLRGLNALYGGPVPEEELMAMGLKVGADVPFCMKGGCALAEGIGELLTPLPRMGLDMVIVKGRRGVGTRALFEGLKLPVPHPDTQGAVNAIRAGDREALYPLCRNALEPAATALRPEIAAAKAELLALGARAAFMTGSGAAVVGLFDGPEQAERALGGLDAPFAARCTTV